MLEQTGSCPAHRLAGLIQHCRKHRVHSSPRTLGIFLSWQGFQLRSWCVLSSASGSLRDCCPTSCCSFCHTGDYFPAIFSLCSFSPGFSTVFASFLRDGGPSFPERSGPELPAVCGEGSSSRPSCDRCTRCLSQLFHC